MQAAEGLASAHRQGLIHRDVKPANILLENGVERVKITDFGLARAADDASLSQAGVIAGTPLYMSPEQARGETLDPRSDLFSLGSVLYTLCTGRAAFSAGSTVAVLKRVCEEAPRPIREVNPDIPEWLAAVVDRLLAKDAGERFQTAGELAQVLGQHLAQLQQSRLAPEKQEAVRPVAAPAEPSGGAAWKRKRVAVVAAVLLMVGVVASLVTVSVLSRTWSSPSTGKPLVQNDPRVLTVSKKPEDGGRFRTIKEALDEVKPEMTIRVLDDGVYEEYLLIDSPEHRGVTLEAAGKAALRKLPGRREAVWIRDVPGFTLRGFRIEGPPDNQYYREVLVSGRCPGVVLDRLDMTPDGWGGVDVYDVPLSGKDAPIVIQNCTIQVKEEAVVIKGRSNENPDRPLACGHVVIRNNALVGGHKGVNLVGMVYNVHVVGNRIRNCQDRAIDLLDLREGAADILVANNTILRSDAAVGIWDDHEQGREFLKCKNLRVQNNLVFRTDFPGDMIFSNHKRGDDHTAISPCDLQALLNSPEWHFSHNWRENDPITAKAQVPERWIPLSPSDGVLSPNAVLSRKPDDPDFLRPPKDSPLATAGAGVSDIPLPAYVGAVPPEGVEPWDWDKTWNAMAR
jgi:hypothetical protein